jgi:hypothetical protein
MARFSEKINSVKFVDTSEKTIEVLYGEDPKKLSSYILPLDYNNQDFLDLLEEISIEEIQDQTREYFQNLYDKKVSEVHQIAKSMFDEWIQIAQADLDKQDEERYRLFEKYKEQQLNIFQAEIINQYKEADEYKSEQLKILQKEIDEQVQGRYKEVDIYREEQLRILEAQQKKEVEETKTLLLEKFKAVTAPTISYNPEKVIKNIIDNFEDEDMVFKTKLEIFNLPEVKNSKDREMKMKVRKAKTVPEIFALFYDIQHSNS